MPIEARHRRLQLGDHVAAVEVLAAVAVAVDGEEHLGLDLGEAVDHAGRAEVGRAARPDRADRGGGEEGDDRLGDVRHVGDDAVAALDPELAQAGGDGGDLGAQLAPAQLAQLAQLGGVQDRGLGVVLAGEDVLGVVERGRPRTTRRRASRGCRARGRSRRRPAPRRSPRSRTRSPRGPRPTSARGRRSRRSSSPRSAASQRMYSVIRARSTSSADGSQSFSGGPAVTLSRP